MINRRFYSLVIPVTLLFLVALWGCSNNQIQRTLRSYGDKPGFELQIIRNDSLKASSQGDLSKVARYLVGVNQIYILKFDSEKGDPSVNTRLYNKLKDYLEKEDFTELFSLGSKNQVGLYLKRDKNGEVDQVLFFKSGGKHSVYIWAPHAKDDK